jgi:hypothetical protein
VQHPPPEVWATCGTSSKREATLRCCWQKPPAFGDEIIKSRPPLRHDVKRLGRLVITRTQRTPTMRHTRTGPSHFVFPDYESSPRCATDLVFYRCMRMSPLAPPAGGAFFYALSAVVQLVLRPPR